MSSEAIIFGAITGASEFKQTAYYYRQNIETLQLLPLHDYWPQLTKDIFTIPSTDSYYRTQILAFGTSYKMIPLLWEQWVLKFEQLLAQLYWTQVDLFFQSELTPNYHYEWMPTSEMYERLTNPHNILPVTHWSFSGGPRTFTL